MTLTWADILIFVVAVIALTLCVLFIPLWMGISPKKKK